jgi:hypothetical protein
MSKVGYLNTQIGKADVRLRPDEHMFLGGVAGSREGYKTEVEARADARKLSNGRASAKAVTFEEDRFYVRAVSILDWDLGPRPLDTRSGKYRAFKIDNPVVLDIVDDVAVPVTRTDK